MSIELSLNKLADVLLMGLAYTDGKVSGQVTGTLETTVGLSIPIKVEATKVFVGSQCGVVCKVMGDLYLIASHYPKMGGICAFLIDGNKLSMEGVKAPPDLFISKKMELKEVLAALKGSVVQAYHYNSGWKTLKLPK